MGFRNLLEKLSILRKIVNPGGCPRNPFILILESFGNSFLTVLETM
jgi:hypothetical protein